MFHWSSCIYWWLSIVLVWRWIRHIWRWRIHRTARWWINRTARWRILAVIVIAHWWSRRWITSFYSLSYHNSCILYLMINISNFYVFFAQKMPTLHMISLLYCMPACAILFHIILLAIILFSQIFSLTDINHFRLLLYTYASNICNTIG